MKKPNYTFGDVALEILSKMKKEHINNNQIKKEFDNIARQEKYIKGCPRSTFYYVVAKGYLKGFSGFKLTDKQEKSNNSICVDLALDYVQRNEVTNIAPSTLWKYLELKSTSSRNKDGAIQHNNQMDVISALFRANALDLN